MNRWQIGKQVVYMLKTATWPDSPNGRILTDAFVSAEPPETFVTRKGHPFAVVEPLASEGAETHAERVGLLKVEIAVVARSETSWTGSSISGSIRTSSGQSAGRGVDEIFEGLVVSVLGTGTLAGSLTDSTCGMQGKVFQSAAPTPIQTEPFALSVVKFQLAIYNATISRNYHQVQRFSVSGGGTGTATLTWVNPPTNRFDFFRVQLIRKAGSVPPASVADGTNLGIPNAATSWSDPAGTGQWSYAIFPSYDETTVPPASDQRFGTSSTWTITL